MQYDIARRRPLERREWRRWPIAAAKRLRRWAADKGGGHVAPGRGAIGKGDFLVHRPALVGRTIAGKGDDPAGAGGRSEPAVAVVAGDQSKIERSLVEQSI